MEVITMLEAVLAFFMILAIVTALMNGRTVETGAAMLDGAKSAVELIISIIGLMALWSGIMRIAEKSGLIEKLSKLLKPLTKRLFKESADDPELSGLISQNIAANVLGLGNAATPAGIEAVRRMYDKNKNSRSILFFMIINTASLQLIPMTVASIRGANGAAAPFDIVVPVWIVSLISLISGIVVLKIFLTLRGGLFCDKPSGTGYNGVNHSLRNDKKGKRFGRICRRGKKRS